MLPPWIFVLHIIQIFYTFSCIKVIKVLSGMFRVYVSLHKGGAYSNGNVQNVRVSAQGKCVFQRECSECTCLCTREVRIPAGMFRVYVSLHKGSAYSSRNVQSTCLCTREVRTPAGMFKVYVPVHKGSAYTSPAHTFQTPPLN